MTIPKKPFLRGNDGGPGRPIGARNRLSTAFLLALAKDFEAHGEGVIKIVRMEKPDVYLRCIASIVPKEFSIESAKLDEMDDEEISTLLATVRELMRDKTEAEAVADDDTVH